MAVKDVSKGQDSNHLCQGSTLSKEYIAPVHSLCLDKGVDVIYSIVIQPIAIFELSTQKLKEVLL